MPFRIPLSVFNICTLILSPSPTTIPSPPITAQYNARVVAGGVIAFTAIATSPLYTVRLNSLSPSIKLTVFSITPFINGVFLPIISVPFNTSLIRDLICMAFTESTYFASAIGSEWKEKHTSCAFPFSFIAQFGPKRSFSSATASVKSNGIMLTMNRNITTRFFMAFSFLKKLLCLSFFYF